MISKFLKKVRVKIYYDISSQCCGWVFIFSLFILLHLDLVAPARLSICLDQKFSLWSFFLLSPFKAHTLHANITTFLWIVKHGLALSVCRSSQQFFVCLFVTKRISFIVRYNFCIEAWNVCQRFLRLRMWNSQWIIVTIPSYLERWLLRGRFSIHTAQKHWPNNHIK